MKLQRSLVVVAVALFMAACGGGIGGSGTSKTEAREVGVFHRVEVSGALEVTLTDREATSVRITTDDNLLEHVVTRVEDGVLRVEPKDAAHLFFKAPTSIEVSWRTLNEAGTSGASTLKSTGGIVCDRIALRATGASRIELDSATGNEVVIWASGASHIKLRDVTAQKGSLQFTGASQLEVQSGSLQTLDVEASGASSLALGSLLAETVAVNVSGASKISVTASKAVSGNVTGASSVKVRGNPETRAVGSSGGSDVSFE